MLKNSLGYHTFTISKGLSKGEARKLKDDFQRYSKDTGLIRFHQEGKPKQRLMYDGSTDEVIPNYRIEYVERGIGVSWVIRFNNYSHTFKDYRIEATINPMNLLKMNDPISISDESCLKPLEIIYNELIKEISDTLPQFARYSLKRGDYCINFNLKKIRFNMYSQTVDETD
jgi:hypothetical protein